MNEAQRSETASKVTLKRVVKCKCGLEFDSVSNRAAHIKKHEGFVSKGVRQMFGYRPAHSNAPGTFIRSVLTEPVRDIETAA